MPDESLFSRSNAEKGSEDPVEGVRLIGADEAEKAVERGEAVRKTDLGTPKYGDRPESPPRDVTPSLRFPLADTADLSSIERPRVAPVEPRRAPGHTEVPDQSAPPVISVEPATGETALPHWTEPATGEVPKVVIGELEADDDEDESARWASFAASAGPRWRDQHDRWEGTDVADLHETSPEVSREPLGALDTTERPTQEEFLTFDDLDVPTATPPRASSRSTDADPIRIQSGANRPAPTRPEAGAGAVPGARPGRPPRRSGPGTTGPGTTGPGTADWPTGDEEPAPSGASAAPPGVPADSSGGRDVPMAVFVGVAIAAVALILFKIGPAATMVIVVAALLLAAVELFGAFRQGGYRPATLLGLAAVVALPLACYWRGEAAIPLVLFLTVVFTLLWYLAGISGNARVLPNLSVTMFGVLYVGLLGSFAALILKIPSQGVSILLVAVVAAVLYDVGGFFVGRRLGRRPLSAVSPHKTVEGLLGGMGASLLGVIVFAVLLGFGPFSFGQALLFGICAAVAAPFGDLCESLLKRDLGIKDMGSLLPEHGGVLDRFDGLLFVLPTAYYVARSLSLA